MERRMDVKKGAEYFSEVWRRMQPKSTPDWEGDRRKRPGWKMAVRQKMTVNDSRKHLDKPSKTQYTKIQ